MNSVRAYYYLAKPGIVYGNSIAAIAGFLLASSIGFDITAFVAMLVGTMSVMASACVVNNMIDRDIDIAMARTKQRALVTGQISLRAAAVYATILGVLGITVLSVATTMTATWVAMFGFFAYVFLYTYSKRYTVHSTLIGTLSGATPPVIGYTAVTGQLDLTALLLFLLLVAWQMPHFYAISIFRRSDYAAAHIPVLSVVRGNAAVRRQITAYCLLYIVVCIVLGYYDSLSWFSAAALVFVGTCWLALCIQPTSDDNMWARRVFRFSLLVLLVSCVIISLDGLFWQGALGASTGVSRYG